MKRYNMILFGLLSIVFTSFFASCEKDGEMAKDNKEWVLVWSDEFDTPTSNNRPDPSKWTYEKGNSGFGNNELQNYTSREENVHYTTYKGVSCLAITALNDNYNNVQYSSARIKTEGLFEIRYGRIEARLLLPYGPGLWPAFWMLGSDYSENPWPACGEIDIMENKGYQPNIVSSALHMPGRYSGNPVTKTFGFQDNRFDVDFHVFAIEWDKEKIDFYVDDVLYTGRTIRAALNALFEYGRPKKVALLVLVDRFGRELPVSANYVGLALNVPEDQYVSVRVKELEGEDLVLLKDRN